jgi:hypothetical protein
MFYLISILEICQYVDYMTSLAEYGNDGTVIPKELGRGVSAVTFLTATNMGKFW